MHKFPLFFVLFRIKINIRKLFNVDYSKTNNVCVKVEVVKLVSLRALLVEPFPLLDFKLDIVGNAEEEHR